jgi:MoaA/NifB/PqqE/SkfB family radical SAM enzyme
MDITIMFKKVYVEITNNCNLDCSFCIGNKREKKFIDIDSYEVLLNKLEGYTDYLYFHVMGEPLLHPKINDLINIASKKYNINITTNGYLINRIKDNKNIRQINISLHSFDDKYKTTLDEYMNNIFDSVNELSKNTYIEYRMWVDNVNRDKILNRLEEKYNVSVIPVNCEELQIDQRRRYLISLFVEEMTKNIVENGFQPGKKNKIIVKIMLSEERITINIKDTCRHFDPTRYYEKIREDAALDTGFGIRMLMALSKNVVYTNSFNLNNLLIEI